ncbi:type VI secretion system Vgr family protein [Pseudomonas extremaustralis]|jgi:type VI secretion system secreted protein VgrG|uniref:Rhs element Vgr protein n=1 Tax=Pseudomonas extremaustralis TaxID=359110 RepID=A0A5C5QPE7_9PSED|nr:type VI secretion system Vgr family protein [Pseudomonas extremaustralis]EZI30072.1 Rhs element Vgr protein [Pseudomonas extremaustralis 14-3 substr. 14-3b]MDF3133215.1 type VI secretion system Vgr family protein [Pseudomonas extremaustralis]TWS07365.1 type VI secretion system tip protein VgrG [Pseudomonas extremaustralis]SDE97913.1 Rhs element Vgr protein [Pseudomonas extremaustralis]SKA84379.1 Rhs element Vgr protein [Pseudomonas extremaustralis]
MALNDHALCTFASLAPSLLLETLWVQQWQGEEKLSEPYRFEVRLATINPLFDDEALLGNRAVLTLSDALGQPHPYQGVVTEVDYLDADSLYFYYRVVLEPRFVQLRHFRFSEIWLDKSLPELIRDVLKLADLTVEGPGMSGLPGAAYDFDIRLPLADDPLTQATFTCQFEETSFAFISRLLEYFGVYYFFEQGPDGEALVFCGDRLYQPQLPSLLTYRRQDSELDAGRVLAVARTFERKLVRQAAGVTLQDFSASNAQLKLEVNASVATASLGADASTEQREAVSGSSVFVGGQGLYGEHFGSLEQGQWLANRRAQAIGCRQREFHGSGRATGLRAGYPMLLVGHPRPLFNAGYQVIEVHHDGYQPLPGLGAEGEGPEQGINTRFIALPGDVQFRAPCVTPRPYVQGVLSAVVDGDEDTGRPLLNEHGCYRVSFPFIRGEKNATRGSAWLRMATLSSGSSHGMNFPLLKGTEVLVSFLGGDPDRPVITGSVPNSENPNVVTGDNATQSGLSTPGGHLFAMEDSPSGPMMKMGASTGCSFTLGEGDVSGAHLRTDKHMQLASSSYKHEIPGVYTLSIGGGSAPKPLVSHGSKEKLLSSNFIADQELVPNAKAATDIYDWLSHRTKKTITALDLSANLTGVKAGIAATGLNVSVALNGVDVSVKVGIVSVAYQWFPIKINNGDIIIHKAKAKKDKLTYSDRSVVVGSDLSKIKLEKSAYFMHLSSNSHEITVGPNTIVLTNDGVVIKSNGIVHIDGDLHVSGDVLMGKALSVVDSIYVGGGAKIGERMVDSSINKPDPFIPSVAIQGLRNIASVQLKKIIIEAALNKVDVEAQVAVGAASVVAAEAVGDVAAGGAADAPAV